MTTADIAEERAVLARMLADSEAMVTGVVMLDEQCFGQELHQLLFRALVSVAQGDVPPDRARLLQAVGEAVVPDRVADVADLVASLAKDAVLVDPFERLAERLRRRGTLQGLVEIAEELRAKAADEWRDAYELVEEGERRLFQLSENRFVGSFTGVGDALQGVLGVATRRHQEAGSRSGVSTGLSELDQLTDGWQRGSLTVLAGRPGVGLTSFAVHSAYAAATQSGEGVAFNSLDLSRFQVAQRLLSLHADVEMHGLQTGRLPAEQWRRVQEASTGLADAPVYIDDTPGRTVAEMRASCRRLQRDHAIGLVVVDHVLLVGAGAPNGDVGVGEAIAGLAQLAKETNAPVLALLPLPVGYGDAEPQLVDLPDADAVIDAADSVVLLNREAEQRGHAPRTLTVAYQANGPCGAFQLDLDRRSLTFTELQDE
ncbi:replicative DNA helicase [Candidatus Latescibacterota bacterium]